ncbi:hypothetical protein [Mangrovimonas yunxiaonensis]|uniref:hypothetical protein n=1 Tax=Mangrovimonas yunxiaonensis TaxID=1197477 RepID=UPI000B07E170|nr:hypothetical protein [Mangrovimonas yunxiaonensis]GGH45596.1 hypothetical protein GCM10011364_19120 [Mangrovimonas yunxiaonensis]
MKRSYIFEILSLDSSGKCTIKSSQALAYSLMSNSSLWSSPKIRDNKIHDEALGITLVINEIAQEEEEDFNIKNTMILKLKGDYEVVEQIRLNLLKHLQAVGLDQTYVLTDEVSSKIACEIYPKVNDVENGLRKYLMKFFITKLGPSWWNVTADSEMKKKVNQRKNNELFFSNYIDNRAYLIDFGELGKIVHSQSSGFISKEDIVTKVLELEESEEAIKKLKTELESNYTKFFKDTFKTNNFQQKWEELEKLRHKVAHNNLFTKIDLERAEELTKSLIDIINSANDSIDTIQFDIDEKDILKENISSSLETYEVITKEELLRKLDESENWARRTRDNFVGLKHFVTNYLGSIGYDYRSSYDLINQLEEEGEIELYEYQGRNNLYPVTAIRKNITNGTLSQNDSLKEIRKELKSEEKNTTANNGYK